ncbi:hypothetical protein PHLCEN_2v649 [Hermanssonia centrifuga]|uniref:NADH:flavin oxidoreductase/NADH oxidase N-terminal domain-containing protein n=1 Tax=Hermanssonia centrifuga TaxID=98765 RepID=A0A2R6S5B1_9APHY|nr:hypothetical protein PHLCEN_2v649 [Hermanssonia centrifuga]
MKPSGQALKTDSRSNSTPSLFSSLIQALMFQTPRAMTSSSIHDVISAFARGAELAARSGFDGIELHAGHGYLIAEFISEETNLRTDEFCATSDPLRFLRSIVSMIRSSRTVPADFAIGIKLNAADYIQRSSGQRFSTHSSDTDEERVLAHVREIATWRMVDFIEISGGNYENPEFMNHLPSSRREALFSRFSKRALQELLQFAELRPLVLLTGGLVTPELMSSALRHNHADLLGIGRLSVLYPELPKVLQWDGPSKNTVFSRCPLASGMKPWDTGEPKSQSSLVHAERTAMNLVRAVWQLVPRSIRPEFPNLIGAGVEMAWFSVVMRRLAKTSGYDAYDIGEGLGAVVRMWLYIAPPYPPTLWFAMIWGIGVILLGILFHL